MAAPWGHDFLIKSLLAHFRLSAGATRPVDAAYSLNCGLNKMRILKPVLGGNGVHLGDRISLMGVI